MALVLAQQRTIERLRAELAETASSNIRSGSGQIIVRTSVPELLNLAVDQATRHFLTQEGEI